MALANRISNLVPTKPSDIGRVAERRGLVRVQGGYLRVFNFATRRLHESPSEPPRTVGQTCMVIESTRAESLGETAALEICARSAAPAVAQAAKEKVVLCEAGVTRVYQADRANHAAALCACGNATGAAAAMLARVNNVNRIHQDVALPEGRIEVRGDVRRFAGDNWRVDQTWCGIQFRATAARLAEREVLLCTGTLNQYVVVPLPDAGALAKFGLEDALALWQEAQRFGFTNPLQSRLVALAAGESVPTAKFFTCGRAHPGAPLTGLATLALAAPHADWLGQLLAAGEIVHARGKDALPAVRGADIEFAPIMVTLTSANG